MSIFTGQKSGFQGFKLERDAVRISTTQILDRHHVPIIASNNFPPPTLPGIGGGFAYDSITRRPYYSDGFGWFPIGSNAPGTLESYSFIKDGNQSIPTSTNTPLSMWEISSSDTYHNIPGWNLTTGVYTAPSNEVLTLEVKISWASGVSNLGFRILRIQHMKFGIQGFTTIKEVSTQADPDTSVETTQECQIHLQISQGDTVRVTVEQDSTISIPIAGGNVTSISGFSVNTL